MNRTPREIFVNVAASLLIAGEGYLLVTLVGGPTWACASVAWLTYFIVVHNKNKKT